MIRGIYIEYAETVARITTLEGQLATGDLSPADAHSKRRDLEALERKRGHSAAHILANHTDIEVLERLLAEAEKSPFQTRHRATYRTMLEQSIDRLRRELGDNPPSWITAP